MRDTLVPCPPSPGSRYSSTRNSVGLSGYMCRGAFDPPVPVGRWPPSTEGYLGPTPPLRDEGFSPLGTSLPLVLDHGFEPSLEVPPRFPCSHSLRRANREDRFSLPPIHSMHMRRFGEITRPIDVPPVIDPIDMPIDVQTDRRATHV